MNAAIYCRISKDENHDELGVQRQETECRQLADRLGWTVVEVFTDDDVTAYSTKPRAGYTALLAAIGAGKVNAVICWHTDRLHRPRHWEELETYIDVCQERDVPTAAVKSSHLDLSNASGRMVARILAAVARAEVEHGIERMRSAKDQAAGNGHSLGGPRPFGYAADPVTEKGRTILRLTGELEPAEAKAIREACAAVLAGVSLRSVARDWNARGILTTTGAKWRSQSVRYTLCRPRNAGLMEHRGEVVGEASWPAIIDANTWRAVVGVLTDPARRDNPGGGPKWLLSGIATCEVCGAGLLSGRSGGASAKPVYLCKVGGHVRRNAAEVDAWVSAIVIERLCDPAARELLTRDSGVDATMLRAKATVLRQRLDSLATAFADGDLDARQLRAGSARLHRQLTEVETELAAAARGSVLSGVVDAPDPAEVWAGLSLDRQRAIVDLLVTVVVLPATRKGRPAGWRKGQSYFDPATVKVEPRR